MAKHLNCPRCSEQIPVTPSGGEQTLTCPACRAEVEAIIFPAFQSSPDPAPRIQLAHGPEAACYFHSRFRANTPCDDCGRFLCELCAISVGSRRLCAECVAKLRKQKGDGGLVHHAALFDNTALFLLIAPVASILFSFFTLISAPAALILSFYYWPRQWTLLGRSRVRFAIAILSSILVLLGWAVLIYSVVTLTHVSHGQVFKNL
jgi:hypothetical protein